MTTININSGDVYNNKASSDGGAIYVKRSIESDVDYSKGVADFKFNLSGGNIFGNKAGLNSELTDRNGGAFCVIDDMTAYGRASKFIISDDSSPLKVHDNTTTKNGGVIYLKNGDIEITGGELYANTAGNDGGAFYVDGGSLTASAGSILSNNTTNGNGGGFYVNSGNVTVADDFIIGGNTAAKNGGGFYVNGGDVGISGASISSNHAVSGAGLYSNGGAVTFTSGDIGSNISSGNGGGIYVNGGSVTYTGNLKGNTACNGGGLYLASGATMTYKGGIISGNKAVASESATATTAYHGGAGNIQGCGGGIYLQNGPSSSKKTSLLFDLPSDRKVFGLYTNEADKAGAEIVSEGGYTSVQLPAIHDMQLIGFEGVEASPSWYQDYFTGDTGYNQDKGHAVEGTVSTVDRLKNLKELGGYQYMEHRIPDERLSQILDHYLCLTLDFNFLNITLKAKGLLGHETALFRLIHHGTVKNTAYDVLLRADKGASETLMNMPWGTYSVVPNNEWHREYDPVESKEDVRIGETDNYVIEYNMNHKSAAQMPQHDERQIQGKDVPSSTVEGEKPEKYNRKEF